LKEFQGFLTRKRGGLHESDPAKIARDNRLASLPLPYAGSPASSNAATAGRVFPSNRSRNAPPPVDM
jgi:hypothetical protein